MTMRKTVLTVAVLLLPMGAMGQSLSELQALSPEDRRAYMESMSDEERAAMREQWRAEAKAMSAEDRKAMREERRARWESMSDEERQAAREHRRQNREDRGRRHKHDGDDSE